MRMNIHNLARKFLSTDGLKIRDTQKAGIFLFADWLLKNDKTQAELATLTAERDTLKAALSDLFQSCSYLSFDEMNRMENEIAAASAALADGEATE